MLREFLLLSSLGATIVISNLCKTTNGSWYAAASQGANDFATVGVAPDDRYFCWEACSNTAMVNQKIKVKLANPEAKVVPRFRNLKKLREEGTQFGVFSTIGKLGFDPRKLDYANRETCEDKVLRQDIKNALTKVTNHSALAIARTLLYQIGRPGWVYNVVEQTDGYAADEILYDMNFCVYSALIDPELYDIHVAAVDMS